MTHKLRKVFKELYQIDQQLFKKHLSTASREVISCYDMRVHTLKLDELEGGWERSETAYTQKITQTHEALGGCGYSAKKTERSISEKTPPRDWKKRSS